MIKRLQISVVLLVLSFSVMAQSGYLEEIKQEPKDKEIVLGTVNAQVNAGMEYDELNYDYGKYSFNRHVNNVKNFSDEELAIKLLNTIYDSIYPKIEIELRNFKAEFKKEFQGHNDLFKYYNMRNVYLCYYNVSATIVVTPPIAAQAKLKKTIQKALQNIQDGSIMALNQIKAENVGAEEDYKDRIIEILLDNGYKVVAKEYLERLLQEQKEQASGIYNDETTVGTGNFTAVGYYVNVRITDESVRVHIVNVETGEYEGNATEKLK